MSVSGDIYKKDANWCDLFAIKVFLNLFGRFFSYFHHNILILLAYFQLSSGILAGFVRSRLKNVFWPNIFVGASLQILDPPLADLRFATHKEDLIRREVPHRGKTRPRRDFEPKSYF